MWFIDCEDFLFSTLYLAGGFKHFVFSSEKLGEMIQFDEHIFQMGWFNHHSSISKHLVQGSETSTRSLSMIQLKPELGKATESLKLRNRVMFQCFHAVRWAK